MLFNDSASTYRKRAQQCAPPAPAATLLICGYVDHAAAYSLGWSLEMDVHVARLLLH